MRDARSRGEAALDKALTEIFGTAAVTREMPAKIAGKTLYVDRVVKGYNLAFEYDGVQHERFVEHWHGDADGFRTSQERDRAKEAWLARTGYTLIRFNSKDKITTALVRSRITAALNKE